MPNVSVARNSQQIFSEHHEVYDDIHEKLHDDVMSFNDADALQVIGECMLKDQNAVQGRMLFWQW